MMKSVGQMIEELDEVADDLDEYNQGLIKDLMRKTNKGNDTTHLSANQIERVEYLYNKHLR